jgi:DHA2 family multidrug resistance protein-like MFS transporter
MLAAAPPERAGAAAGISETSSELGGALGIAVLGSVVTAVYRADITAAIPADVPTAAADVARNTLGGAVDVATKLPDEVRALLLQMSSPRWRPPRPSPAARSSRRRCTTPA